ncbi:hypothetical protein AYO41_01370 [Verrucomicrobia bacterium SCGC AG-212-E04]|nr:hypothetical protein AYO41_01370 [Verrucomicrobia bacterium SCGC AG-212-E04]
MFWKAGRSSLLETYPRDADGRRILTDPISADRLDHDLTAPVFHRRRKDHFPMSAKLGLLLIVVIIVAALHLAKDVFIPIALAILLSFLLTPVASLLERLGIRRSLAAACTVFLALVALSGVGLLVIGQVVDLTERLPAYRQNMRDKIAAIKSQGNGPLSRAIGSLRELADEAVNTEVAPAPTRPKSRADAEHPLRVQVVDSTATWSQTVRTVFGSLVGLLAMAAVVVVFVLFILIERTDLRDRIIHLVGRGRLNVTTQALDEAGDRVIGYLSMQVIINTGFGVAVTAALSLLGVPNAMLWGLLAGLLRFVPYLGVWIAMAFPLILSLAISTSWSQPIGTTAAFVALEIVTSNFIEPWLYGARTGLSPVAILITTVFWTWLWGGVGLLLATPLTVCVAVVGKYVPRLHFLEALLGEAPAVTSTERFYQRLLAQDRKEAQGIATAFLAEHTLAELYSQVFIPAVATAEREEASGMLDPIRHKFVMQTTDELGEDFAAAAQSERKNEEPAAEDTRPIFCIPASDLGDEVAADLLARVLQVEGFRVEVVSSKSLMSEIVEQITEAGCTTVCISATPPHDDVRTRYLCKSLRLKVPGLHLVVGLWDSPLEDARLASLKQRVGADRVLTTLTAVMNELRPYAALDGEVAPESSAAHEKAGTTKPARMPNVAQVG